MTSWIEIQIPVPWGFIAAKASGNQQNLPVLCVHGIQDNANTFDHLIPLLTSSYYYVCVDLPGHGLSSPFPSGVVLDFLDYVFALKRILLHFNWGKVIYMAHSLGAQLGAYFSMLYPENVSKLIMIDAVAPFCVQPEQLWDRVKMLNNGLVNLENRLLEREAPKYTYEEAVKRMVDNRFSKISEDGATTLIKRSLVPNKDGYSFSTDQRLKFALWVNMSSEMQIKLLSKIRCPQLLIIASESAPFFKMSQFKNVISTYQKRTNFKNVVVEGKHDVHLDHPERIAGLISKFLKAKKSSL